MNENVKRRMEFRQCLTLGKSHEVCLRHEFLESGLARPITHDDHTESRVVGEWSKEIDALLPREPTDVTNNHPAVTVKHSTKHFVAVTGIEPVRVDPTGPESDILYAMTAQILDCSTRWSKSEISKPVDVRNNFPRGGRKFSESIIAGETRHVSLIDGNRRNSKLSALTENHRTEYEGRSNVDHIWSLVDEVLSDGSRGDRESNIPITRHPNCACSVDNDRFEGCLSWTGGEN